MGIVSFLKLAIPAALKLTKPKQVVKITNIMTITLISKEKYEVLMDAYHNHKALYYEAKGYDTPDKTKWTEEDREVYEEVSEILKESIVGFCSFTNFCFSKKYQEPRIRFQYIWDADAKPCESKTGFQGVGYILISELLNGFKENRYANQ